MTFKSLTYDEFMVILSSNFDFDYYNHLFLSFVMDVNKM
jgi:hypothetical protein